MAQLIKSAPTRAPSFPAFYAFCALFLLAAAVGCGGKTPVPFKRGEDQTAEPSSGKPVVTGAQADGAQLAATFTPDTRSIRVEGAVLERKQGAFRASLAVDLDGDGKRDALLLASDEQGRPLLETALRDAHGLQLQAASSALFTHVSRCELSAASITPLGNEAALVSIDSACAADGVAAAQPAGTAAPNAVPLSARQRDQLVVSVELGPHVLLQLASALPRDDNNAAQAEPSSVAPEVRVTLHAEDLDADEHSDVRASVEVVSDTTREPAKLELSWLNRPSGLARETAEPEHTLATLAQEAWLSLTQKPQVALAQAERALLLHRALCREAGLARLFIDGRPGLSCGASAGAGRAAATRAIALAHASDLLAALDAQAELTSSAYHVDDAQSQRAKRAIELIQGKTSYVWQMGPAWHVSQTPPVRLSALGFLAEDHVLLRGPVAQSYELASHTLTPEAAPSTLYAIDVQGHMAVTDIVHACDGEHLQLVSSALLAQGAWNSGGSTQPLVLAASPEANAACLALGSVGKPTSPEPIVLGQSAAGVVLARNATLYVVPLADTGLPSGAARALAASEPAPPLTAAAAISSDGVHHALATSQGVAVVDRASGKVSLIRPPASCTGPIGDVALSPSARRIAMLCDGHLYVAQDPTLEASPLALTNPVTAVAPAPVPPPTAATITSLPPPEPSAPPRPAELAGGSPDNRLPQKP